MPGLTSSVKSLLGRSRSLSVRPTSRRDQNSDSEECHKHDAAGEHPALAVRPRHPSAISDARLGPSAAIFIHSSMNQHSYPLSNANLVQASSCDSLSDRSAAKKDTDQILSYYQSEDAGRLYTPPDTTSKTEFRKRRPSSRRSSTTSSEYSSDSVKDDKEPDLDSPPPPGMRSRLAVHKEAEQRWRTTTQQEPSSVLDRRATSDHGRYSSENCATSIRSRRGLDARLDALGSLPPLAALPGTLAHVIPPSTAPASGPNEVVFADCSRDLSGPKHQRSASEAVGATIIRKKRSGRQSSRDIGIVGTGSGQTSLVYNGSHVSPLAHDQQALKPPIFQMPKSRSPSPGNTSDNSEPRRHERAPADHLPTESLLKEQHVIVNSESAQGKRMYEPIPPTTVVTLSTPLHSSRHPSSPHVASLRSDNPPQPATPATSTSAALAFSLKDPSPYLCYQPGLHATAGPLPPPPRAIINTDVSSPPPRPPRLGSPAPPRRPSAISIASLSSSSYHDVQAMTSTSQPSPSIPAASSEPAHAQTIVRKVDSNVQQPSDTQLRSPVHVREGAFPPSTLRPSRPTADTQSHESIKAKAMAEKIRPRIQINPSPTIMTESKIKDGSDVHEDINCPEEETWVNVHRDQSSDGHSLISPPDAQPSSPVSPSRLKNAFLKRFSSLPRTPSSSSRSTKALSGSGSPRNALSSRSSSPRPSSSPPTPQSPPLPSLPQPRKKIKSQNPAALWCSEVFSLHSSLERSMLYAEKINELYIYDCGLADWLSDTKAVAGRAGKRKAPGPNVSLAVPSSRTKPSKSRRSSPSSVTTEATFPMRADASVAIDLAPLMKDDIDLSAPPALPYPALALAAKAPPRSSSLTTASGRSPASTKPSGGFFATLGRKASLKKGSGNATTPQAPSRVLTKNVTTPKPRPVEIQSTPSVPGGPRAPPYRVRRSQTVLISPFSSSQARGTSLTRRPSLSVSSSMPLDPPVESESDPDFDSQVKRLQDLLPHVEKDVLRNYLRRAGQDILAIGQYLEDERNGVIRRG